MTIPNPYDSPTARRAFLAHLDRLAALDDTEQDLVRLGQMPDLHRWLEQIRNIGGCAHPIYITGRTTTRDTHTGAVLRHYTTHGEPGGRLAIRCGNRRSGRCPSCSRLYQGDTFHLMRAGLIGGKGIPDDVRTHPRVFATLTAPSFGAVHRAGTCHTTRRGRCTHGRARRCRIAHAGGDGLIGQPVCTDCYDYVLHILWNAHAPRLWNAFSINLYHHFAAAAGIKRSKIRKHVRICAAKVAEYQARGAIHFHTVIRIDGPNGPGSTPAAWATTELLIETIRTAAGAVNLSAPPSSAYGERQLPYGDQLEAHALRADAGGTLTDEQVAAYVAKYTTKSAHESGALDHRIGHPDRIPHLPLTAHHRALIGTCWRLGHVPELAHLNLQAWAHTLGYRGHCLTKSRTYSTTYTELRAERAHHQGALYTHDTDDAVTESAWAYAGSGYRAGEQLVAAAIWEDVLAVRDLAVPS
ncbi:replication initiator [Streptacidiphilus neutrinimicus]|uniref:replication initiator n=1 Tax=Streptacidiphilus neutrinimicus TaxID=105420 RepID=UPI000AADE631|nr:replication initiator [Streptacidiphilus neutrinimicus]